MKHKIIMRATEESEITKLKRKLKGLPARKPFVATIDSRLRDRYGQGRSISDAGVAPAGRKRGRPATRHNRERPVVSLEAKIPFTCVFCGKAGMAKLKKRRFCYNKGLCKGRYATAQKKEKKREKV